MLTLLQSPGFRRVGTSAKGPEYHGPCPKCGGRDRFHVWPEQGESGSWWCRQCGKGGDLIEFYRWRDGASFREACERAGRKPDLAAYNRSLRIARAAARDSWTPAAPAAPAERWSEHAGKLAAAAAERLQSSLGPLAWLAKRGIDAGAAASFGLGFLPRDEWRPRESWGLPTETKRDGSPKKLWLPAGLVIPCRDAAGRVTRLRIRRDNPDLRYYIVPGSSREPLRSAERAEAWIIVESELDAIALAAAASDLPGVAVAAMGNSTARPTESLHAALTASLHISVALDNDPPKTEGGADGPGAIAAKWWNERYRQARRTPPVGGKDPGEMAANGVDLREWLLAGLPPRFRPPARSAAIQGPLSRGLSGEAGLGERPGETAPPGGSAAPATTASPEIVCLEFNADGDMPRIVERRPLVASFGGAPPPKLQQRPIVPNAHRVTVAGGREIYVTDDLDAWRALTAEGRAVFLPEELERLRPVFADMDAAEHDRAAEQIIDVKEVLGGYITEART